jgi:hypothetical protein
MLKPRNQEEIVQHTLEQDALRTIPGRETTEKVYFPGIDTLYAKSKAEIGEALANVLKSRPDVLEIRWRVGENYIELSYIPR